MYSCARCFLFLLRPGDFVHILDLFGALASALRIYTRLLHQCSLLYFREVGQEDLPSRSGLAQVTIKSLADVLHQRLAARFEPDLLLLSVPPPRSRRLRN